MKLEKAEEIAKEKFRAYLDSRQERLKDVKDRIVMYSGLIDDGWEVCLGVLPKSSQSFEEFKKSPKWDNSEDNRARDWIKVFVAKDGKVELSEVADLEQLLLI